MNKCKLFVVMLGYGGSGRFSDVERTSHSDFPGGPTGATALDPSLFSGCWMLLIIAIAGFTEFSVLSSQQHFKLVLYTY